MTLWDGLDEPQESEPHVSAHAADRGTALSLPDGVLRFVEPVVIGGALDQADAGTDGIVGVGLIERVPVTSPSSGDALQ